MRETRQLPRYGVVTAEPELDYGRLLERVAEVTRDVRTLRCCEGSWRTRA